MRNVLITGCSSGIGRATALKFHENDWRVHATARDTGDLSDLDEMGMETHQLDVTDYDEIESVVDVVTDMDDGVYCLVNNAGYGEFGAVEEVSMEEARKQFDVNFFGAMRTTQEALPYMRDAGEGRIINISSIAGLIATPGMGVYAASKHALEALSDSMRVEVKDFGVDVVLIEPGPVKTRFGEKADETLESKERNEGYDWLYEGMMEYNSSLDEDEGFSFVVGSPDQVARAVYKGASKKRPKNRYKAGWVFRAMSWGRYVPSSLMDFGARRFLG